VITAVKDELAGYKAPRHVVFVAAVPRAPNGKPDHASARSAALTILAAT
jgi:acyl-CoA synthetase (AMP-forming)/AMP-acid ligase II